MNATKNPPPVDQGLAFQTHALQMILLGPFYGRTRRYYGPPRIVTLQKQLDRNLKLGSKQVKVFYTIWAFNFHNSYLLLYQFFFFFEKQDFHDYLNQLSLIHDK